MNEMIEGGNTTINIRVSTRDILNTVKRGTETQDGFLTRVLIDYRDNVCQGCGVRLIEIHTPIEGKQCPKCCNIHVENNG